MSKWIAEFDLEDGDIMPGHMDLEYKGAKLDFHCRPLWIPVSERLPKENEYIGDVCKYYLIQDEYGDMHVAHLSNIGWIPMGSLKAIGYEIIAWQELPESYKTESEGEE